jgi:hypothetical protein
VREFHEEMMAEMKTNQKRPEAKIEASSEKLEALREKMLTGQKEMKALLVACIDKMEANAEEIKSVAENQEVSNEEAAVETVGALEDRYGNRYLAVGCRRQPNKRTQGFPQELAVPSDG